MDYQNPGISKYTFIYFVNFNSKIIIITLKMTDNTSHQRRHKDKKVNDWTLKKEKLLRYWQEECKLYNWLYRQNVEWYQKTNRYMSTAGILLSAITGTTLINQSGNTDSESDEILFIVFGLLSITSTFIQGVKEFMDYNGKISNNTLSARQNSSIVIDIEEQLNLSRSERINGKEFMKHIKTRKNGIIQNGPMIPKSSWKKLRNSIRKKEGLNFFNQNLFQNYLDQNVDYTQIDFNLDTQSSGSSGSEHSFNTGTPTTLKVPKVDPTKLHKLSKPNDNLERTKVRFQNLSSKNQITEPNITNNITKNNNTQDDKFNITQKTNSTIHENSESVLQHLDVSLINDIPNNSNSNLNNFEVKDLELFKGNLVRSNSQNTLQGSEDEFLEDMQNNNVCMYELRNKISINDNEFNKRNTSGINLSNIANLFPNFLRGGKGDEEEETQLEGIIIDGNNVRTPLSKKKNNKDEIRHSKTEEKTEETEGHKAEKKEKTTRKEQQKEYKKQRKKNGKKLKNQLKYHTSFI